MLNVELLKAYESHVSLEELKTSKNMNTYVWEVPQIDFCYCLRLLSTPEWSVSQQGTWWGLLDAPRSHTNAWINAFSNNSTSIPQLHCCGRTHSHPLPKSHWWNWGVGVLLSITAFGWCVCVSSWISRVWFSAHPRTQTPLIYRLCIYLSLWQKGHMFRLSSSLKPVNYYTLVLRTEQIPQQCPAKRLQRFFFFKYSLEIPLKMIN